MYLEETVGKADDEAAVLRPRISKTTLLPALICAGLCVALMRTDFLTIFFLVPLGFCSIVYGAAAAWLGLVFAVLGHSVLLIGLALYGGMGLTALGLNILYFTVLTLGFVWIMAGNPPENRWIPAIPRIRTVFRFTAASIAAALVFVGAIFAVSDEGGFILSRAQIEVLASAFIVSSGADAVQQALLERMLTPERIIATLTAIVLRGGALFLAFFVFFFSRQAAGLLARLVKRRQERSAGALAGFFVPRRTIWVLSLCLPVILLCRVPSLYIIEIAAWNVLVICVIMFLAQGSGIVLYNLARRHMPKPMPFILRLLCGLLCVFLVFSPGINMMAMGALVLLGIAETWLPLRKMKENSVY